jgi:hypothetical protein
MSNYLLKCIKFKMGKEPNPEYIEDGWIPFCVTEGQGEWIVWLKKT